MEQTIRWGIIGCGDIANKRVAAAIKSAGNSRLVACVRKNPDRLAEFQLQHGVPKGYVDTKELFSDPERASHRDPFLKRGTSCQRLDLALSDVGISHPSTLKRFKLFLEGV